jgi:hypothetical protein
MAIINRGEILLEAEPLAAIKELQGKIWRQVINKSELGAIEESYQVISTKLLSGRTVVHVLSDQRPGENFQAVAVDLEDVYFSTLKKITI